MPHQNTTFQVQTALRSLGFPPGPVDGVPGARTTQAIRNYQLSRKLKPDGVVGAKTLEALRRDGFRITDVIGMSEGGWAKVAPITSGLTPWLDYAISNIGVAEIKGGSHSPTIMSWIQELGAKALGIQVKDDETAWCGTFAGICVARSLPNESLPAILVRASSWSAFGVPLVNRSRGAIMTFKRDGGGHVGFYVGEDPDYFHIIGGNQGNRVSQMRLERDRLTATRWPSTVPLPTSGPVLMTATGVVSKSEA